MSIFTDIEGVSVFVQFLRPASRGRAVLTVRLTGVGAAVTVLLGRQGLYGGSREEEERRWRNKRRAKGRERDHCIYNDGLSRPNPDPDDAGPIVRRPMGFPIAAGCDTAWNRTRVCSDASSTEIQCLRLLRHSGD